MTGRPAPRRGRRAAVATLVIVTLIGAASCERRAKAAAGDGPYADKVAEIVPKLEKSTGLRFKRPPKIETRSKAEVRAFLERTFSESQNARDLEVKSSVEKRLGLLPDTLDTRKLYVDLLSEQVVGFYDPKTKVLYVVEGSPPEQVGLVVGHELVHALQDQYFNLDSLQHVEGDDDRVFAAQAVIEGQANYEQLVAMIGEANVAERLPGGWDRIRQEIRERQSSMPVFAGAPMLVQETLIFPYLSGSEFMRRFKSRRKGVPYDDMPQSSEQILHEAAYFGAKRDEPLRVTIPRPAGATVAYENDLGEFETRLFLFQHLGDQNAAIRGAAGWGGDRYQVVDTPQGRGLVWVSVWDTPVDAAEFNDMLGQAMARRYGVRDASSASSAAGGTRTLSVPGRRVTVTAGDVQGRPAVVLVDVPAGAGPVEPDLRRVEIR